MASFCYYPEQLNNHMAQLIFLSHANRIVSIVLLIFITHTCRSVSIVTHRDYKNTVSEQLRTFNVCVCFYHVNKIEDLKVKWVIVHWALIRTESQGSGY